MVDLYYIVIGTELESIYNNNYTDNTISITQSFQND